MTTPSLKKLITGFLVLAALTASSLLIFLYSSPSSEGAPAREQVAGDAAALPKNAFVEPLPAGATTTSIANSQIINTALPSSNLTEALAANLAQGLVKANPEGPQVVNGSPSVAAPDLYGVSDAFAKTAAVRLQKIPDWESDAEKIKIIKTEVDNQDNAAAYLASVNEVTGKLAARIGITDPASSAIAIDDLEDARLAFDRALRDAQKIPAPASFAALHKSLVKLLAYERNVAALAAEGSDDPVEASIILRAQEANYNNAIFALQTELQKQSATRHAFAPQSQNTLITFTNDLFGIKKAYAFLDIADFSITFDPTLYGTTFWQHVQKVITETIKEQLIHKLVNQVINWVQGGGKPQFITNWKGFLKTTADNAAGSVIANIAPRLCSSFGPLIRLSFQQVNTYDAAVRCTLNQVVRNVQDFYDNFGNGGWIAYSASLRPSNNFFGALIETSDIVAIETAKQKEAKQQELAANKGFKSPGICTVASKSGSVLVSPSGELANPNSGQPGHMMSYADYLTQIQQDSFDLPLPAGEEGPLEHIYCASRSNTTPGGLVADQLSRAIGSPIDRIVNAQDWTNLITALINSGLNRLIHAGVKGLQGALEGNIGRGSTNTTPAEECVGLTGKGLAACLNGGVGGDLVGQKNQLKQAADANHGTWQDYADANSGWLADEERVSPILGAISASCPAAQKDVSNDLSFIAANKAGIVDEAKRANSAATIIGNIINQIPDAQNDEELNDLANQLSHYDPEQIAQESQAAKDRLQKMQALALAIGGIDITHPFSCPGIIPPLE